MFRWYQNAAVCHVWLSDLAPVPVNLFKASKLRWFSRGWTLQELLAPAVVEFYDRSWAFRGTKHHLRQKLSAITKISEAVLEDPARMFELTVAQRMSWAASRQTTRPEDLAYCLLGIFQVNMPLLYGEGERAFLRLQEEIAKETNDQSLFAWRLPKEEPGAQKQAFYGVFASSPALFVGSSHVTARRNPASSPEYTITNKGVRLKPSMTELDDGRLLLFLDVYSGPTPTEICIWIRAHGGELYSRVDACRFDPAPVEVSHYNADPFSAAWQGIRASRATQKRIYLLKHISPAYAQTLSAGHHAAIMLRDGFCRPAKHQPPDLVCKIFQMRPKDDWVGAQSMIYTHHRSEYFFYVWFKLHSVAVNEESPAPEPPTAMLVVCRLEGENRPFTMLMEAECENQLFGNDWNLHESVLSRMRAGDSSVSLDVW